MLHLRIFAFISVLTGLFQPTLCFAGVLEDFLRREEQENYCGIESYQDVLETSCSWDSAARTAGDCGAPQYLVVVGKRSIYRKCRSLFAMGLYHDPLEASAPVNSKDSVKMIWNLMKAVQPFAVQAVSAPRPACYADIKPYHKRTLKSEQTFAQACDKEWEKDYYKQLTESNAGMIVRAIEKALIQANFQDANTISAVNELTLFLEDEGIKADPKIVNEILARFK